MLELFTTSLLIDWPGVIVNEYELLLRKGTATSTATDVFTGEQGQKRWADFETRVGEHVRHRHYIIIKCYCTHTLFIFSWPLLTAD